MNYPAGARFISFEGEVRVIRAATRETIPANADTQLYPGDTVQTQTNGRARIGLADGSTLVVKPNSTIIIRDNARADDGKRTNVHVKVDSGQLSVRTEQQADGTTNVVETPKTKSTVGQSTSASFGVNAEGTEEIRVASGGIETTNASGEKTAIRGGEYVSVNNSGRLSAAQRLLDVPLPSQPHDLEKVFVGSIAWKSRRRRSSLLMEKSSNAINWWRMNLVRVNCGPVFTSGVYGLPRRVVRQATGAIR
jgi:uncharacterized cupin superfamily protein